MALSFIDKIKAIKLSSFKFVDFEKKVSNENDEGDRISYLVFKLDTPIEEVISSLTEYDPSSQKRIHDVTYDVEYVSCNVELIEKYQAEFKFDEDANGDLTKSGTYNGDMFLDLSRRGEVWLIDEKFSKLSGEFRGKKQNQKVADIVKRMEERRKGK